MKKIFQKAFLFVATMTLSLGFASCSDDDGPVTEGNVVPATELSAVANTYVNDIINPTYKDLRDNAKVLKDACDKAYANAKAGNLSDADITDACEAFKNARVNGSAVRHSSMVQQPTTRLTHTSTHGHSTTTSW